MTHILEDLQLFLSASPTSWHAVQEMGNRLAIQDFIPLQMVDKWQLKRGGKYFVVHEGSLAAFVLPKQNLQRAAIVGAHTDSPALKIKPCPNVQKANMILFGVEVYGAPILPSWLNRDLAVSGRVIVLNSQQEVEEHLVFIDDAPLFIPYLAYHLDRESQEKGILLNKQDHLFPIATLHEGAFEQSYLEVLLRRHFSFHTLLSFDLFLTPLEAPRFMGGSGEMLASYRLDNLVSAHAGLVALGNITEANNHLLQMGLFWDHEEIGSASHVGAYSPLFLDILDRLSHFYSLGVEEKIQFKMRSTCFSIDVSHAFNPNYEKKYDPNHQSLLGGGIVLKHNANLRYATSAKGSAHLLRLCEDLNLKCQSYVSRSDIPSGSTIGPVFAETTGIETIDLGIPLLSMHAAREVMACQDYIDLCTLLTHYLQESS